MTTSLVDNRDIALTIGYAATDWNTPVSYDYYVRALEDCEIKAVVRDGVAIGAVYTKGNEVHASILPEWRGRWATRGILKQILHRGSTTRVSEGHDRMYGILGRLGFVASPDGLLTKEV